jgi:hypothetical protein
LALTGRAPGRFRAEASEVNDDGAAVYAVSGSEGRRRKKGMMKRVQSELRGRAGRTRKGSKGRSGASRRRQAGGARSMARRLTGRG